LHGTVGVVDTVRRGPFPVLLAGCLCLAGACAAPTLPLPPPDPAPLTAPDADGMVTVRGRALERALVFVFNEDTEHGVITIADDMGDFETQIAAASGDTLTLWQRVGTDDGALVSQTVP
jgi:hypothetical protein